MRVIILGSGGPHPDPQAGGSAMLLSTEGHHYLIDCGHGATQRLVEAGIAPASINHVFLSHIHYDHVIDLPLFVLSSWIAERTEPLNIFGPKGTKEMAGHLFIGGAFDGDIRARSQFARRQDNLFAVKPTVTEFGRGTVFENERLKVTAAPSAHVAEDIMPCFGLRFEAGGKSMVFSSDTAPCDEIRALAQDVDLLIHECAMDDATIAHRKKTKVGIVNHTPPQALGEIAAGARVKSLVAIHQGGKESTNPVLGAMMRHYLPDSHCGPGYFVQTIEGIRKHYDGPVRVAQDLMRIDI